MTREVRANVIFLVVLFFLAAPGFGLLMYKKLSGNSPKSNSMAVPVAVSRAYNQPMPYNPQLPAFEPRVAREWVQQQLRNRVGPQAAIARDEAGDGPMVSDARVTQLAGLSAMDDGTIRVALVRWDEKSDLATDRPALSADAGGRRVDGTILRTESTEVPKEVRHALQDVGYVDPPSRIWWIDATLPPGTRPDTLRVQYRVTANEPTETIDLPKPATTRPNS